MTNTTQQILDMIDAQDEAAHLVYDQVRLMDEDAVTVAAARNSWLTWRSARISAHQIVLKAQEA